MTTDNKQTTLEPCKWCGDKAMGYPQFLDQDGVLCSLSGEPGILSHAYDDSWWPCLKFGVEMRCTRVSAASTAPVVDELRLLLRRVCELKMDEGFSSHYQRGFEQFRDQMSAVLKARLAAAASPAAPAEKCIHCDLSFLPSGPDSWCKCQCHKRAVTPPAAPQEDAETILKRAEATFDAQVLTATQQLTKARRYAAHTEESGEVCRVDCEGCNDPVGQIVRELQSVRAAPTPSQRARDAEKIALAIVEEITPHIDAYSRLGHDWKGQIAAQVIKHLTAAETVGEREED